jgi:hypothetical protein
MGTELTPPRPWAFTFFISGAALLDGSTYLLVQFQLYHGETSWKKLAAFVADELV